MAPEADLQTVSIRDDLPYQSSPLCKVIPAMFLTSVFLMVAALAQTTETPTDTLLCTKGVPVDPDGFGVIALLETDKAHRQVAPRLTALTRNISVGWNGALKAADVSGSRASLTIEPWPLPKNVDFPIMVEVSVDGSSAGQFSFTTAETQIVDIEKYREARRLGQDGLSVSTRPGVQIPTIELQRFWAVTTLTVETLDRHGNRADVTDLVLPRWKQVADFARASFPALERDRIAKECRPVFKLVAFD